MSVGNLCRDDHDNVAEAFVWRTVTHIQQPLLAAIEHEIAALDITP